MFEKLRPIMEASLYTTDIDNEINEVVANKLIKDWLPTQALVDKTMAGKNVYNNLITDTGKPINYGLSILSESSELLDSIPWKHWKDIYAKPDLDNLKVEIVDLMHFLPSVLNTIANTLHRHTDIDLHDRQDIEEEILARGIFMDEYTDTNINIVSFYGSNPISEWFNGSRDKDSIYDLISEYQSAISMGNAHIIKFYMKKELTGFDDVVDMDKVYLVGYVSYVLVLYTLKLYSLIFGISIEETIEELWSIYLIKNTLNVFRVKNGYKDGIYIKIWNGKEDNVIVNEIASSLITGNKVLDKELLYSKVEEYYSTISNG